MKKKIKKELRSKVIEQRQIAFLTKQTQLIMDKLIIRSNC